MDILVLQDVLHGVQLPLGVELTALNVVGVQHGHPRQVHQGADVVNPLDGGAGEGDIGVDKGQIAHQKAGGADEYRGPQVFRLKHQGGIRVFPSGLEPIHQPKHSGVHRGQKNEGQPHGMPCPRLQSQKMAGIGPQLPLQGRGKLRRQKGAGGEVDRARQRNTAAGGDEEKHQPHRPGHAGQPQGDVQLVGNLKEHTLEHQSQAQQTPQPEA